MNSRQVVSESLATVDAALAIINKYPELEGGEINLSGSINPFAFLLELFKSTKGYDWLINKIASFLAIGLPVVEIGVKAVILSQLKNLLTCSINPFVTTKLIREGVEFNIDQLDLTDLLHHSPLDSVAYADNGLETWKPNRKNMGKYYYFDCEGCEIADDVKYSEDMNALFWFMKHRSGQRQVWKKTEDYDPNDNKGKYKKSNGIVTLDFHERATEMMNSDGSAHAVQVPITNCLQVFVGNAMPKEDDCQELYDATREQEALASITRKFKQIIGNAYEQVEVCYDEMSKLAKFRSTDESYNKAYNSYNDAEFYWKTFFIPNAQRKPFKNNISDDLTVDDLSKYVSNLQLAQNNLMSLQLGFDVPDENFDENYLEEDPQVANNYIDASWISVALQKLRNQNELAIERAINGNHGIYPQIQQNYYYRRTIIQFDFDFVSSIKLFDSRVLTAQLIDQIIGIMDIDYSITAKEYFIKEQIQKMIEMIIQTDDVVVDDCFFAFSNEEYSAMLNRAEQKYAGIASTMQTASPVQINVDDILASLDPANCNSQQAGEMIVAIEGALQKLSGIHNEVDTGRQGTKISGSINFLDNLLDKLAFAIVSAVLSPKVYMLFLFNLKVLGHNTNFNLSEFIGKFATLIVTLIREVRDQILKFLISALQEILGEIARNVVYKITIEQAKYYIELIKRCIACFKSLRGKPQDWDMDNVMHADIESTDEEIESERTC